MVEVKETASSPVLGALIRRALLASAHLPIPLAQGLGATLGALSIALPGRRRRSVLLNLAMCLPELSARERARLARRNLAETGRSVFELGAIWARPADQLERLAAGIEGGELYQEAIDRGKGVILLAPHIGNWEFMNFFLMQYSPSVALYRAPRITELDSLMRDARQRTGTTLVPATTSGVRQLFKALREGRPLFILPDQEPVRAAGAFAPFFGIPALTMTLVNRLLRKSGATPLFGYAERIRGRFRIRILPAPEGLDDEDQTAALIRLNQGVEDCVRCCPSQYLWTYRRFKTRPEGELTPYRPRSLSGANRERLDPVIRERLSEFLRD